jgi:hypothetical protein
MEKVIVFKEDEFNDLLLKFVDNFIEYSNQGYGNSLFSNETGERITDKFVICGSFMIPWNKTFK